ncbi:MULTISPECIES: extracellular solute-binding protein [unclassified Paenibacillus]|uniref:extracellular solute-binding protein n=1 Tax=unclassified Paenibacillus TaxID=185978 RepID=UPI00096D8986|nr:extracellular solute-binding protein [Paenibacillus sp. FSL H8-0259]OMF28161.1 hypothetical protein BK132_13875 [Paenibacillus sp. FSL H8-0259]
MKQYIKKAVIGLLAFSFVAGCSSGGSGNSSLKDESASSANKNSSAAVAKNEKKIQLRFAAKFWGGPKWTEDHPTIKFLNEKFNVDIKLDLINGPEYDEKLKVMAASGSLPDFYPVDAATYLAWQSEGAFLELTDWLPKYPNLFASYPLEHEAMKILNPKDKVYGIPEISWIVRDTVQIRKDWLDKLGMKVPTAEEFTVDKYYEIAKAFAQQDPDGNGKNDTIGFAGGYDIENLALRNAFGIANPWMKKDGKLIPHQSQVEEYKAFLKFMNKAYDEGVLDRDFMLRKSTELDELKKSNKLGIFSYHNNYKIEIESAVKKAFPDTNPEIVAMAPPIGPNGYRGNPNASFGTTKRVINAKADEEKIDRILQILDWWVTDEGTQIMKNGIEGIHYKKGDDGKWQVTDRWEPDVPRFLNSNLFKRPGNDFNLYLWTDEAELKRHNEYTALAEKYPWPNDAMGLEYYSKTSIDKSASLNAKFQEAVFRIIVGEQPVDSIEQASSDWLANGGEQIIKEINEAANK